MNVFSVPFLVSQSSSVHNINPPILTFKNLDSGRKGMFIKGYRYGPRYSHLWMSCSILQCTITDSSEEFTLISSITQSSRKKSQKQGNCWLQLWKAKHRERYILTSALWWEKRKSGFETNLQLACNNNYKSFPILNLKGAWTAQVREWNILWKYFCWINICCCCSSSRNLMLQDIMLMD